ncbi:DMT family transporter [Tabrizicola sp. TH137]|uniref:DMT family transporter n=1 Tax=Tabrizicola sp. TH137 TaxID=2067452 RepID=UPI0026CBDBE2
MRKDRLDAFGGAALFGIALLLAFNQIIVKWVNEGLQPVFFAGLRSVLAVGFVWAWLHWRGRPPRLTRSDLGPGLLIGTVFALEFLCLFLALDLTAVSRASVIFYSMPVWFAIMAHFVLPGERITPMRAAGLALAFAGTAWAILSRDPNAAQGSLAGDLLALGGAFGWAATALVARASRLRHAGAEMQLFWMVLVSGPILLLAAPFFGPLVRDLQPEHVAGLIFQSSLVVAGGFIGWLWLLSVYPAATVASFSFLTPILAILLGAVFFDESVTAQVMGSAALVALGIVLINRRPRVAKESPDAGDVGR